MADVFEVEDSGVDPGFADYDGLYADSGSTNGLGGTIWTNGTRYAHAGSGTYWTDDYLDFFATLAHAIANTPRTYYTGTAGPTAVQDDATGTNVGNVYSVGCEYACLSLLGGGSIPFTRVGLDFSGYNDADFTYHTLTFSGGNWEWYDGSFTLMGSLAGTSECPTEGEYGTGNFLTTSGEVVDCPKTAIVSFEKEWIGWNCSEEPQIRFFDTLELPLINGRGYVPLKEEFFQSVEEATLDVISVTTPTPVKSCGDIVWKEDVGWVVDVRVKAPLFRKNPTSAIVRIGATAINSPERWLRFKQRHFYQNAQFWASAHR